MFQKIYDLYPTRSYGPLLRIPEMVSVYLSRRSLDRKSWFISCVIRTSSVCSRNGLYPSRSFVDRKSWIISFIIQISSASSANGPYPCMFQKINDLYPTRSPLARKSWIVSCIIRTSSACFRKLMISTPLVASWTENPDFSVVLFWPLLHVPEMIPTPLVAP